MVPTYLENTTHLINYTNNIFGFDGFGCCTNKAKSSFMAFINKLFLNVFWVQLLVFNHFLDLSGFYGWCNIYSKSAMPSAF